jgi:hypothetical protein
MAEFLLLVRGGDYENTSPEQMQKVVEEYMAWAKSLREQGNYKGGDGLRPTGRILSAKDGKVTDGPFVETKDAIGGYLLITAKDYDEAAQISRDCPGLKYGEMVEIREIMDYT